MTTPTTPLFAVDSNFLFNLVGPSDAARDALDTIRERSPRAVVLATESVLNEIDNFVVTPSLGKQVSARKAQTAIIARGIQPALLDDPQDTIARSIANKLLIQGVIPWEERNDARILAEAAVLGCQMLITSDSDLCAADRAQLARVLWECDVSAVVIRTPREIVREFGGR